MNEGSRSRLSLVTIKAISRPTSKELTNIKFRQRTIEAQRKALDKEVKAGNKSGFFETAAIQSVIRLTLQRFWLIGTDKYASTQRSVRRQLLTMEEQSARHLN